MLQVFLMQQEGTFKYHLFLTLALLPILNALDKGVLYSFISANVSDNV